MSREIWVRNVVSRLVKYGAETLDYTLTREEFAQQVRAVRDAKMRQEIKEALTGVDMRDVVALLHYLEQEAVSDKPKRLSQEGEFWGYGRREGV